MDSFLSIKSFSIRAAFSVSLVLMLFASMSAYQVKAADKPSFDKPVCLKHSCSIEMQPDGFGGYICLWCIQNTLNQMEDAMEAQQARRYAAETALMENGPDSDDPNRDNVALLEDQMERGCLLRDERQESGGYACYSAMISARSDLSLPATAKYSFEQTAGHKSSFPTHDDLHEENLAVESLSAETTTTTTPSVAHNLIPPIEQGVYEEFQTVRPSVQDSEGSSIAYNLIERLEKRGYGISGTHASALPRGEAMLLLRDKAELPVLVSLLSDFNIKFADQSLLNLKSLLLSGKYLIIRMIQKDGMITVIHIHPVENKQALIITELGLQSSPICIENLTLLLSAFLNHEEVTELAVFTHEAVPDDPAPSSEGATAAAMLTNSLTVAIIEYIQQLGHSSPEYPPIEHTGAIRELKKTQDQAELALSMPNYGFQPGPTEGSALQNVEALTGAQTPFMAQLMTPDQEVTVINFQPEASGDVMLSLSGRHFVIDRREIGALFDWIINQFKPVIQIFILAPLYF